MNVIHESLLIFQILNLPKNLADSAGIFIFLQKNFPLFDKGLASSSDSIEFKTSNKNKWRFFECDQSLSILIVSVLEKALNVCILLDYTILLYKISMACRKERNPRLTAGDREKRLHSSSRDSHLYQNSLPIAKKVSFSNICIFILN